MHQICDHIRYKNINRVGFRRIEFQNLQAAISELGDALLESPKLKELEWCDNPIESTEDMTQFMRVLSQSDTVDSLTFMWNGNENAQALLSGFDFSTYKHLILGFNNLQTNGRTEIPDLIAANTPLDSLFLHANRLNDDDAVLIAQALGGNTHLRMLHVADNNIQERGMRALYEAINDTSTLNALSDCNHSCFIHGLSDNFDVEPINRAYCSPSSGLNMNRMWKIHKLMVDRYSNGGGNVPHLNMEMSSEDTVLLAPFMMESVVRRHAAYPDWYDESYLCRSYSLGLLYELVKDWKMAELFSFR